MISTSILNRKITIQKSTVSKNDIGTVEDTWEDYKYAWANVYVRGGDTSYLNGQELPYTTTEFTIRYDEAMNYNYRIKFKNDYYKILHVEEMGRKEGLKIRTIIFNELI